MTTVSRRHKLSPPPSPPQGQCDSFGIWSGSEPLGKRVASPRSRKMRATWIARAKLIGGVIVACVFVTWTYSFRLQMEQDETRNLKVHPATAIKNKVIQPIKLRLGMVVNHLKQHLRGSDVSEVAQDKMISIFSGVSREDQRKVLQVLKHVIDEGVDDEERSEHADQELLVGGGEKKLRKRKEAHDQALDEPNREKIEKLEKAAEDEIYKRATQPLNTIKYADRHILNFLDIVHSDMCKDPVVDLSDPNYSTEQAVEIFDKCRLLIFKNAFDVEMLEGYRQDFADFIQGLKDKRISRSGSNTGGDSLFLAGRGRGRYEIVLPERLIHPDIVANERIMEVVQHWKLLGGNSALRSLQSLVSEGNQGGGTPGQPWHFDQGFLFGQERGGLQNFGIAGHDLPPEAISLALPLLDMDRNLGPTEFCVGSSALNGVGPDVEVLNQTLIEEGSLFQRYFEHDGASCPAECWRSPLLNFGDGVLWDYGVRHRGGWNSSPYLRSIVLLIYSKRWFDDINFGDKTRQHQPADEDKFVTDLLSRTRLALPDRDEHSSEHVQTPLKEISHIYPNEMYGWEQKHKKVDFIATNWDVQGNPTLYIDGVAQGYLPAGSSKKVQGGYGDLMELRLGTSVVGRFKCSDEGQFVFTQDATW